jgi:hypothetical protein
VPCSKALAFGYAPASSSSSSSSAPNGMRQRSASAAKRARTSALNFRLSWVLRLVRQRRGALEGKPASTETLRMRSRVAYDVAYAAGLAAEQAKAERMNAEFAARDAQHAAELKAEQAQTEKAIAAFASLADRLDAMAAERRRPWWRRLAG